MAVHLNPLLDADPDASRDDYVEHFLPDMTVDGKLYGLPTDAGPMIWQYNTDLVAQSGLPSPLEYYEQGEWNWDTHVELGKAITDIENNIYFHTSFYSWAYWLPMAWTFGGSMFNEDETQCLIDSEPFVTAIQYALDMKDTHQIMPAPGTSQDLGLSYRSGNVGMNSAWSRQPLNRAVSLGGNDKVQPCFVAAGPEGAQCITKSNNEFVSSQSEYTDLAYDLIKMITGPEGEWGTARRVQVHLPCNAEKPREPRVLGHERLGPGRHSGGFAGRTWPSAADHAQDPLDADVIDLEAVHGSSVAGRTDSGGSVCQYGRRHQQGAGGR